MDKNKAIKIQIADEYEQIRKENQHKQAKIKLDIYNKIPRIEQIDIELSNTQQKMIELTFRNIKNSEKKLDELQKTAQNLLLERKNLLLENNYSEHSLSDIYNCRICKDTGVVNGNLCKCYQKKFIDILFENSEMHEKLKTDNFSNFDYNLFSASDMSEGISPRENIRQIRKNAENFILNFDDKTHPNLYLYGKSGLGKTYLSSCIAHDLISKGHDVIYKTFYELIDIARLYKFDYMEKNAGEKYDLLIKADLLIIDDLDSNYVNSFSISELFHILNTRILNCKKTIISSNIDSKDLEMVFDERIASRIYGHFLTLKFIGEDLRL